MYVASVCDVPVKTYLPENDRSAPRFVCVGYSFYVQYTVYALIVVVMRFFYENRKTAWGIVFTEPLK